MLRLLAFAGLASTAALMRSSVSHLQRPRNLVAQMAPGWVPVVDPQSGQTYYYNEQTGGSQWEPPQYASTFGAQDYGTQLLVRVVPTVGVICNGRPEAMQVEYTVRNGQEQVLGRYDMAIQNPYISRAHCFIRVAEDGVATVSATGKLATAVRQPGYDWQKVRPDQTHLLVNGHEIALDPKAPENAVFTVYLEDGQQHGYVPQGGYYVDEYGYGMYR